MRALWRILFTIWLTLPLALSAKMLEQSSIADQVVAPYSLGDLTDIDGVWELKNGSGLLGGYVIQSEALAPLPGFSGGAINMMVIIDLEGNFIDVKLNSP